MPFCEVSVECVGLGVAAPRKPEIGRDSPRMARRKMSCPRSMPRFSGIPLLLILLAEVSAIADNGMDIGRVDRMSFYMLEMWVPESKDARYGNARKYSPSFTVTSQRTDS